MVLWPSGKAKVCKTFIPQFKSGQHLHVVADCASSRRLFLLCIKSHLSPASSLLLSEMQTLRWFAFRFLFFGLIHSVQLTHTKDTLLRVFRFAYTQSARQATALPYRRPKMHHRSKAFFDPVLFVLAHPHLRRLIGRLRAQHLKQACRCARAAACGTPACQKRRAHQREHRRLRSVVFRPLQKAVERRLKVIALHLPHLRPLL